MSASELAQGNVHHVDASAGVRQLLGVMEQHQVRRLPVIDDDHRIVGMVSEADIARHLPEHEIARFGKAICSQRAIASGG